MNNQGEVTLAWGDGNYTFRLSVKGAIELEQKCDAPFAVIFGRLNSGAFKINDVIQTIRLGLIGGGARPTDAMRLVDQYGEPLSESLPVARAIVGGMMFGFEASPLGEAKAAPKADESPNVSTPPRSPELQTSLASIQASLDELGFGNSWPQ